MASDEIDGVVLEQMKSTLQALSTACQANDCDSFYDQLLAFSSNVLDPILVSMASDVEAADLAEHIIPYINHIPADLLCADAVTSLVTMLYHFQTAAANLNYDFDWCPCQQDHEFTALQSKIKIAAEMLMELLNVKLPLSDRELCDIQSVYLDTLLRTQPPNGLHPRQAITVLNIYLMQRIMDYPSVAMIFSRQAQANDVATTKSPKLVINNQAFKIAPDQFKVFANIVAADPSVDRLFKRAVAFVCKYVVDQPGNPQQRYDALQMELLQSLIEFPPEFSDVITALQQLLQGDFDRVQVKPLAIIKTCLQQTLKMDDIFRANKHEIYFDFFHEATRLLSSEEWKMKVVMLIQSTECTSSGSIDPVIVAERLLRDEALLASTDHSVQRFLRLVHHLVYSQQGQAQRQTAHIFARSDAEVSHHVACYLVRRFWQEAPKLKSVEVPRMIDREEYAVLKQQLVQRLAQFEQHYQAYLATITRHAQTSHGADKAIVIAKLSSLAIESPVSAFQATLGGLYVLDNPGHSDELAQLLQSTIEGINQATQVAIDECESQAIAALRDSAWQLLGASEALLLPTASLTQALAVFRQLFEVEPSPRAGHRGRQLRAQLAKHLHGWLGGADSLAAGSKQPKSADHTRAARSSSQQFSGELPTSARFS